MKENSGHSDWKVLFGDLLAEQDEKKIVEKLQIVENAIYQRAQELPLDDSGVEERREMRVASKRLLRLKIDKLGYPLDPKLLGKKP